MKKSSCLKKQRDEIRAKATPIIEEINVRREKIAEYRKKVPRESQQDLQEELDAIEWKIQTTSLDLQEEKRLIETVKELEIHFALIKKLINRIKKLRN